MSDKEDLSPVDSISTGISVTAADLNTLMRNAVGAGLQVLLETRSEHGSGGSYPQIRVNVYKPPTGIRGSKTP